MGKLHLFNSCNLRCCGYLGIGEVKRCKRWVTLLGSNISPTNALLKMIFPFPKWDMLVPWRGCFTTKRSPKKLIRLNKGGFEDVFSFKLAAFQKTNVSKMGRTAKKSLTVNKLVSFFLAHLIWSLPSLTQPFRSMKEKCHLYLCFSY